MEILHVIGLAIFTFLIVPNMTSGMSGLMLTNCMSFIPAVLCKYPRSNCCLFFSNLILILTNILVKGGYAVLPNVLCIF